MSPVLHGHFRLVLIELASIHCVLVDVVLACFHIKGTFGLSFFRVDRRTIAQVNSACLDVAWKVIPSPDVRRSLQLSIASKSWNQVCSGWLTEVLRGLGR